jgi:hypothetical protein
MEKIAMVNKSKNLTLKKDHATLRTFLVTFAFLAIFYINTSFAQVDQTSDNSVKGYAERIQLDFSKVKNDSFDAKLIESQLGEQLSRIQDTQKRIEVYYAVKTKVSRITPMMFIDLEQGLIFAYLTSPQVKGKSLIEKSQSVYNMQKKGMVSWTSVADLYEGFIFCYLASSDEYLSKSPVEKLKFLDQLREKACPLITLMMFKQMIFWTMMDGKSEVERIAIKDGLVKEGIQDVELVYNGAI